MAFNPFEYDWASEGGGSRPVSVLPQRVAERPVLRSVSKDKLAQDRLRARNDSFGDLYQTNTAGPVTPQYLRQESLRTARGLRDIFTPYPEIVAASRAASEGRPLAALGWGTAVAAGTLAGAASFAKPAARGFVRGVSQGAQGVAQGARQLARRIDIEREVARARGELRGGNNPYFTTQHGRLGPYTETSPFSYHLDNWKWEENFRNRDLFWGKNATFREQDQMARDFFNKERWDRLSGDQKWSRVFDERLRWGPFRDSGHHNSRYNPFLNPPIRAGGDEVMPLYWKRSGSPITADGIKILPWDNYGLRNPIEMRPYADPFFNNPIFNQSPIIDINRRLR